MNSKNEILRRLRDVEAPAVEAPDHDGPWIQYDDVDAQFAAMVAAVGGVCHQAASTDDAMQVLEALPFVRHAGGLLSKSLKVVSQAPTLTAGNVDLDAVEDPHVLADVDLAIVRGHFGVAENGAVWVSDEAVRHRVIFFLPQHVAVIVPRDALVHNMHEAYERMRLPDAGQFGMFLSGPSKTADIEQSLVIGAHGARSLTVIRGDF